MSTTTSVFDTIIGRTLPAMPGGGSNALAFPAADAGGGYRVSPGLGGSITSYTLVYDLLLPPGDGSDYAALLQTDIGNGGDADLFVRRGGEAGGIGIGGVYEGEVSYGAWHRLAFSFEDLGNGKSLLAKYIDGALAGKQEVDTARYTIDGQQGFLILADEDGETRAGALGGFLFDPTAMTAAQVAALGGPAGGGILPAPRPDATQFDFAQGDLGASFGPGSLAARDPAQAGEVGELSALALPPLPDAAEGVLRYPAAGGNEGFLVKTGLAGAMSTYTLVYDLQIRPETMATFGALLQTDTGNGNDGELFLRWTDDNKTVYGTGISGQYEGSASGGGWHRVGFTVTDQGNGTATLVKFIDGIVVGTQSVDSSRFTLNGETGFLIMTDEDGEVASGYLASFAVTDVALSPADMAALGGVRAGGIFGAATAPGRATQFDFEAGTFAPSFGDGSMNRRAQDGSAIGDAAELGATPLPGSQNEGVLGFPATEPGDGYAINPGTAGTLASYTLVLDLLIPEGQESDYGALLQTGEGDAELFLKRLDDGSIGLGISGQYDATMMEFGGWHRIAITVADAGNGTALLTKFVDGIKVGSQSVDAARFSIDGAKGFMVLSDDDGESWSGWLNSLHIADRAMADAEVAALGEASAGGIIPTAPAGGTATQFDFNSGSLAATYGPGTMAEIGLSAGPVLLAALADHRVTPAQESLTIDLAGVFEGEGLTYAVTTSKGKTVTGASVVDGKLVLALGSIGFDDVTITATDTHGLSASDNFRLRMAGENAYTIAVLPDTQDYVFAGQGQKILNGMTQWLADNADTMNLRFVMSVGDVVASNQPSQWAIAKEAFATLNGVVPYSMLPGNHDQGSGGSANNYGSLQSNYFDTDYMKQHSTLGGVYDQNPNETNNAWYSFTGEDGTEWIVLALEFGARDDVLRWAGEVLDANADKRAILTTHHYTNMGTRADNYSGPLFAEGTGKDYGIGNSNENANDGEDMWQSLVSKHSNVSFVFSGHVFGDGAETIVSYNEAGQPVFQMLVNYQNGVSLEATGNGDSSQGGNGGNGAIRLVTIDPDNNAFYTETYLSATGEYITGSRGDPEPSRDGKGGETGTPDITIQPIVFGTPAELDLPELPGGGEAHVLTAPKFDPNNGLKITPGFAPADGGTTFDAYTLVYDLYLPAQGGLASIFQTDLNNITDGDLWLGIGANGAVIGTNGQDEGNLPLESWHRLVFTVERVGEGGSTFTLGKYVNGVLQGTQTVGAVFNITKDGFLIFADDSFETPQFSLSSFAFVEKAMSAAEVAALGGVTAGGPFAAKPDGVNAVQFDFTEADLTPSFGEGTMSQTIGSSTGRQLTGRLLEHQETVTGVYLGTPETQFRAHAGDDKVVEASGDGATVSMDAGKTVDPLHQVLRFEWLNADGEVLAATAQADLTLGAGVHRLTLRVTDAGGTVSTDDVKVAVTDAATLLHENFDDGNATGWQSPGGNWQLAGSVHSRDTAVEGIAAGQGAMRAFDGAGGVMRWQGQGSESWSGYTVSATLLAEDQKGLGLVAYYQDDQNHYRLSFDIADHTRQLVKVQNGVETVLARESATSPFDRAMTVELAVADGRILATLDGEALFGGVVEDQGTPLAGGTVGLWSEGQRQVVFDDIFVRQGTLIADAGKTIRVVDTDGDGFAEVDLSALASFGIDLSTTVAWSEKGAALASGAEARVQLGTGDHLVRLDMRSEVGEASDTVKVQVIAARDVLLQEDFSAPAAGWRFVDEGELGAAAAWSVQDGRLVQAANRYSRELGGTGDTAPTSEWSLNWSPLGDGIHALRKGTYALYEGEGAAGWQDYAVDVSFTAPAGGGVGLLLHYADDQNYYKLEFDNQTGLAQLFSLKAGIEQTLWQAPVRYDADAANQLHAEIVGGKLQAWLGDVALFTVPIEIRDTEKGSFGLYNWGNAGVSYDDVRVVSLSGDTPAPLNPVTGSAGDDVLVGGEGDDHFVGGAGYDIVQYGSVRAAYALTLGEAVHRLSGPDGNDRMEGVEAIRFLDSTVELSAAGGGHLLERLYEGALGRGSDAHGLAFWMDKAEAGLDLGSIASSMLRSAEAGGRPASADGAFVTGLYDSLLGREASASELAFWSGVLGKGLTRGDVLVGIASSSEAQEVQGDGPLVVADLSVTQVARAYEVMLGRDPDLAGLGFWEQRSEGGMALEDIMATMAASQEFLSGQGSLDNPGYVQALYTQAFGRTGEAGGIAFWTEVLEGGASRASVAHHFLASGEGEAFLQQMAEQGVLIA